MKTVVILQPQYFPWAGVFEQVRLAEVFVHLDDAQFSKGGFSNRVQVKDGGESRWLTVPLHKFRLGTPTNAITPAAHAWKDEQVCLLQRLYAEAPFATEMLAVVEDVFGRTHETLADLSIDSVETVCRYLGISTQFLRASRLGIAGKSSERVHALATHLGATHYVTGHGARNYLDHDLFEASAIRVEYMAYARTRYPQLGGTFDPHVSILDLIANTGKEGLQYLQSPSVYWKEFLQNNP